MRIRINGAEADIQLETEKTVGEVLSALGSWLEGTGHRLSGLGINGQTIDAPSVAACFAVGVEDVDTLDVYTSPVSTLFCECLLSLLDTIGTYEVSGFAEKASLASAWGAGPAAKMLGEQSPALAQWAAKTFSGDGSSPQALRSAVEERLREFREPAGEMEKIAPLVADVCARLEELPLDVQTGKDARAAETVNIFSGIAEKVFRVYGILGGAGLRVEEAKVGGLPIADYIAEFHASLQELLAAYEQRDTVLVGDIAEYEIAPRLRGLYAAVSGAARGA